MVSCQGFFKTLLDMLYFGYICDALKLKIKGESYGCDIKKIEL